MPSPRDSGPSRVWPYASAALLAFAAALGLVLGGRTCARVLDGEGPPPGDIADLADGADAAAPPPKAPAKGRCERVSAAGGFLLGEGPKDPAKRAPGATAKSDAPDDEGDEAEADLSPFAVEIGRGALFSGGFTLGTLRDEEGGSVASVVTLDRDGGAGRVIKLARSRGDLEAPIVAASGSTLIAAMMEPNASGRALKVARIEGSEVRWGLELSEGRDESLAYDLALGASAGVLTWDDVTRVERRGVVSLAAFDPASFRVVRPASPVSDPRFDADTPRIAARPGGFWLVYIAREEVRVAKRSAQGDIDEEGSGEQLGHAWLEVIPLDETAGPAGSARAVTPKDGNVLAFDLAAQPGGELLLAVRDDDTPVGSSGGTVTLLRVSLSAVGEPIPVAAEEGGVGVPDLLPGWLALANIRGPMRLVPLDALGTPTGPLLPETAIGLGEIVAATGDVLLVAKPEGRALRLGTLRCVAELLTPPAVPPAATGDAGAP